MTPRGNGIGGHHRAHPATTDDWLTPPHVIKALGHFDLDPCCPETMPWSTADRMIQRPADGFAADWKGRVFLNPPYGNDTARWMRRLARHWNGIALVFARTETRFFRESVWGRASALLFLFGRLTFLTPDGTPSRTGGNSGGPSVLVAYGGFNAEALRLSGLPGALVESHSLVREPAPLLDGR